VGLVGAAILLLALVGVFRYESAGTGTGVTYSAAAPKALQTFDGSASGTQAYVVPLQVNEPNLTALDFRLEASGATFNVTVVDPSGQTHAMQGPTPLSVMVAVAPLPQNGTVPADDHPGVGTWNVTITMVQAPSSGGPVPTPPTLLPGSSAAAVPFHLTPYATEWVAG
jgi:hypothetical protein